MEEWGGKLKDKMSKSVDEIKKIVDEIDVGVLEHLLVMWKGDFNIELFKKVLVELYPSLKCKMYDAELTEILLEKLVSSAPESVRKQYDYLISRLDTYRLPEYVETIMKGSGLTVEDVGQVYNVVDKLYGESFESFQNFFDQKLVKLYPVLTTPWASDLFSSQMRNRLGRFDRKTLAAAKKYKRTVMKDLEDIAPGMFNELYRRLVLLYFEVLGQVERENEEENNG